MSKDDLKIVSKLKKAIKEYPEFRFFLADKRGGNDKGIGKDRSVILARFENSSKWFQFAKVWGVNNRIRAIEITTKLKEI